MELHGLTGRKLIDILLFLSGIIEIIICNHLAYLPTSAEQESGYISPARAESAYIGFTDNSLSSADKNKNYLVVR